MGKMSTLGLLIDVVLRGGAGDEGDSDELHTPRGRWRGLFVRVEGRKLFSLVYVDKRIVSAGVCTKERGVWRVTDIVTLLLAAC